MLSGVQLLPKTSKSQAVVTLDMLLTICRSVFPHRKRHFHPTGSMPHPELTLFFTYTLGPARWTKSRNILEPPQPAQAAKYKSLRTSTTQFKRNIDAVQGARDYLSETESRRRDIPHVSPADNGLGLASFPPAWQSQQGSELKWMNISSTSSFDLLCLPNHSTRSGAPSLY